MKKHILNILLIILLSCSTACATLSEQQRRDYGVLSSAVTFASDKVIGEYGEKIPDDFDGVKFMVLIRNLVPDDYYEALGRYDLNVTSKGSYYLLIARQPDDRVIILFDYSCTPKVDGPVYLDPDKYDVSRIESYDTCK